MHLALITDPVNDENALTLKELLPATKGISFFATPINLRN
jgi:hypothetical protein